MKDHTQKAYSAWVTEPLARDLKRRKAWNSIGRPIWDLCPFFFKFCQWCKFEQGCFWFKGKQVPLMGQFRFKTCQVPVSPKPGLPRVCPGVILLDFSVACSA